MQYFCFMCLNVTSGAVRVARFPQQNPPNCYSKLAQSYFEEGSPVKFQGLNIWGLGNTLRRRRRRHFLKLHSRHYLEKTTTNKVKSDRERDFIWLQFTINTSNRHTFYLHFLVCYCSSSIQAPCFSLLNLNVTLYIFFWHCHVMLFYFIYLNLCVCTSNMFGW